MEFGVVIPYGAGREENLTAVLECLDGQDLEPKITVVACDGPDAHHPSDALGRGVVAMNLPKHEPGMEQPRNAGVRLLETLRSEHPDMAEMTHVWFLDSDILVGPDCLANFAQEIAVCKTEHGAWAAPYDWMGPGIRDIDPDANSDPRWAMFHDHDPGTQYDNDLSKGLGCFSGNLVWNIKDFAAVGGFWNEMYHGRCEDGELGIRAVAMGVPIGLVPKARGWHMDHPRDYNWITAANSIDVPKINARHPWVEGEDVFVVEEDGKRFNCRCACGWEGNTALIWEHREECPNA